MAASLVQKEEQNNGQGNTQESSDLHEFEESDDSTETGDDSTETDDDDDEDDDEDENEDEDEDGDGDDDGDDDDGDDDDGDDDDDDTNGKDDDDVVDDGPSHCENVEGIITKADFSTDSKERDSLLGSNNDNETNL